ncbi:TPA: hypothetical protein N2826_004014 [Vibrio parahaemolyticus]|uniref:hypothetical protein n=1 Tax=Vibrio parahaemolyticus TaxID=670 RepID=UPI001120FCE2|nr:hypothetical protein [Vibrio parahaemolyticus]MBE4286481.1 hypothetical protein [Vibrio parahaemolyticus]TOH19116.1 hypothetical protein CGI90_03825 [Vibrio parahaemolyticus]HCG7330524.1 hypothetical protein [Vibrio parahaemolyticus]HCG9589103.1 hypothetical protein [Vibrio parahaemolyticus]HCM0798052.1 hypothetical protein [Vibrio parahaemolyticus]
MSKGNSIDQIAILDECSFSIDGVEIGQVKSFTLPNITDQLAKRMGVPKALLESTPSLSDGWMKQAIDRSRQVQFVVKSTSVKDKQVEAEIGFIELEKERGITIGVNPLFAAEFGSSMLTAAIKSVIQQGQERHQRKQELIAARSGKYCSHKVLKDYMAVQRGDMSLKSFVELAGGYDLMPHQRSVMERLLYGTDKPWPWVGCEPASGKVASVHYVTKVHNP